MPIVVSRKTGEIISAPKITQEQKEAVWAAIVKAYAQRHPELFDRERSLHKEATP